MALIVHDAFPLNGRTVKRGEVLTGVEAEKVASEPLLSRKCSRVPDHRVVRAPRVFVPKPKK